MLHYFFPKQMVYLNSKYHQIKLCSVHSYFLFSSSENDADLFLKQCILFHDICNELLVDVTLHYSKVDLSFVVQLHIILLLYCFLAANGTAAAMHKREASL